MKLILLAALVLNIVSCSHTNLKETSHDVEPFKKISDFICSVISKKPSFKYEDLFLLNFRKAISYEQLVKVFSSIHDEFDSCEMTVPKTSNGIKGEIITKHKNNVSLVFLIALDKEDGQFKISSLRYTGKVKDPIHINSYKKLEEMANKQEGKFSILYKKLSGEEIFKFKENERHALGSVFKLYILASLLEKIEQNNLSWSQKFKIKENLKSLPSGEMQNLKNGVEVSLLDFASKMISISDNTATDHLLNIVKKEEVENLMDKEGLNSYLSSNKPFLSTLEMFKTRAFFDKKNANKYSNSNRDERGEQILNIPYKDRDDLLKRLSQWRSPRFINQIEWFATPKDICNVYQWMDARGDKKFRQIMGLNTPFVKLSNSKKWAYAGYKGGSEPGVLEMTYLLEDKKGSTYCLYIGQNNSKKDIVQEDFFALVEGILNFLENS